MSKWLVIWGSLCLITASFVTTVTYAQSLKSPNYQFDESTVGAGGLVQSSSDNFRGSSSLSDLSVDNATSSSFQIEAGSQTSADPTLSFSVDNSGANFGNFTASGASVATSNFSVSNYTSYGYVAQIVGDPPTNGNYTISPMEETGDSQAGFDQFGINVVANTLPVSVGANPDNGDFGFGVAAPNYGTSNKYRYVSGETIAFAPKSSGITDYTISYLVNVDSLTPGGKYTSSQTIIVTGTY